MAVIDRLEEPERRIEPGPEFTVGDRADVWNSYDFIFPGVFLQRTSFRYASSS